MRGEDGVVVDKVDIDLRGELKEIQVEVYLFFMCFVGVILALLLSFFGKYEDIFAEIFFKIMSFVVIAMGFYMASRVFGLIEKLRHVILCDLHQPLWVQKNRGNPVFLWTPEYNLYLHPIKKRHKSRFYKTWKHPLSAWHGFNLNFGEC